MLTTPAPLPKPLVTMSGKVRVIEYDFLVWEDLEQEGFAEMVKEKLGSVAEVGVLRCTIRTSTRVTLVGRAEVTRDLIASGRASRRGGLTIAKADFPIVLKGWPKRTRADGE